MPYKSKGNSLARALNDTGVSTSGSAVSERPRDALRLSFNSVIPRAQYFIIVT